MTTRSSNRPWCLAVIFMLVLAATGHAESNVSVEESTDGKTAADPGSADPGAATTTPSVSGASAPVAVQGRQYKGHVAIYSVKEVFKNLDEVREAHKALQAMADRFQKDIDALAEAARVKRETYEQEKSQLSQEIRDTRETEIRHMDHDYRTSLKDNQDKINAEEQKIFDTFGPDIKVSSAIVAARLGCKSVRGPQTANSWQKMGDDSPTVDITPLVLEELQKEE